MYQCGVTEARFMSRFVWTALALIIFVAPADAGRRNRCNDCCNPCMSRCNTGCGMGCGMGCGTGCGMGCGYGCSGCGSPCGGVATPAVAPGTAPKAMPSGAMMPVNPTMQVVYYEQQPRRVFGRTNGQMVVQQPQMAMATTQAPPAAGTTTEGATTATAPTNTVAAPVMMANDQCNYGNNWYGNNGGNYRRGLLFRRR